MSFSPKFKAALAVADYQIQQIVKASREAAEFSYLRKDAKLVSVGNRLVIDHAEEVSLWLLNLGFTQGMDALEIKNKTKTNEERFNISSNFEHGVMELKRGILSLGSQPMKDILVLLKPFENTINPNTDGFNVFLVLLILNEKALTVLNTVALLKKYD